VLRIAINLIISIRFVFHAKTEILANSAHHTQKMGMQPDNIIRKMLFLALSSGFLPLSSKTFNNRV